MMQSSKKLAVWAGATLITLTGVAGASVPRAPHGTAQTSAYATSQARRAILLADQGGDDKKKDDKKHDRRDDKDKKDDQRHDRHDDRGHDFLPHWFA